MGNSPPMTKITGISVLMNRAELAWKVVGKRSPVRNASSAFCRRNNPRHAKAIQPWECRRPWPACAICRCLCGRHFDSSATCRRQASGRRAPKGASSKIPIGRDQADLSAQARGSQGSAASWHVGHVVARRVLAAVQAGCALSRIERLAAMTDPVRAAGFKWHGIAMLGLCWGRFGATPSV